MNCPKCNLEIKEYEPKDLYETIKEIIEYGQENYSLDNMSIEVSRAIVSVIQGRFRKYF